MIIIVRAYTTRGLGTPTVKQNNIFDSEKLIILSCALDRDSNLSPMDLESHALPTEPLAITQSPQLLVAYGTLNTLIYCTGWDIRHELTGIPWQDFCCC